MHVGFSLLTLFPGLVGGSETYVHGVLGEFAAGNGPEDLAILANRHVLEPYARYERGPVRLHHVASYRPGSSTATRAAAMALARALPGRTARDVPRGLDVLHYPVTVPIPELDLPKVVTIHEVQLYDRPEVFSAFERRYRRWAYDGSARSADVVIAVSDYVRRRLVEEGVDPARVETIPYGIDHERWTPGPRPEDERALARHSLPERFVVYPANIWPHKNPERLVEAFAQVSDPSLHLVLAGQTYGRLDPLLELARRLGIGERISHVGHVAPAEMPALLRRAFGVVFPSLYEGFGLPPIEAMACGVPIATSDRASLAEVVGDAAIIFDPESPEAIADAIDRLGTDGRALRDRGIERAARFSWPRAAERHVEVYERAAAGAT